MRNLQIHRAHRTKTAITPRVTLARLRWQDFAKGTALRGERDGGVNSVQHPTGRRRDTETQMRVAHFNPLLLASSSSFAATAGFGFRNAPMRRGLAESAENVDRAQLPDWAKAIIQNPQPTRVHRIHKGLGQGSQWTP